MTKTNDNVNHPAHYTDGKIEVWDFILSWDLAYCLGCAVKYISRAGKKDGANIVEDLRKAIAYIDKQRENDRTKPQPYPYAIRPPEAIDADAYAMDKRLPFRLSKAIKYITFYVARPVTEPSRDYRATVLELARNEIRDHVSVIEAGLVSGSTS